MERDPSVLVACERSSLFDGTCLFAHGANSKCAHGVRTQQSFRRNMSVCARSEIQVCSQRANAAVCRMSMFVCARSEIQVCSMRENAALFSPEHVSLRTERDPSVLVACERSSLVA